MNPNFVDLRKSWSVSVLLLMGMLIWMYPLSSAAVTYANASIPIAWVDPIANSHMRVGHNTSPYKFSNTGGCGTTQPVIDDTLSDNIPIGFTFWFGGNSYTNVRINTNGRLQFNNTTCGAGTANIGPPQTYPYVYPNSGLNNTMKLFGVDLDPTDLVDRANYPTAGAQTNCKRSGAGSNNCGVYITTTGTAPYRSFIVTWYNVPEWVNFSNTSGSFTMQAILQENGEFIYQYLSLNHGGTGTGEVGWQVDSQDYDKLQFPGGSEPANNTAVKFYIPQPVSEYRMEQISWGSVLDTSGNGRHGAVVSAGTGTLPTPTPSGKVCRGGTITDNSTAAAIGAIETPYTMQTVGSQGTVTLWYKHKENNLNRMLLDASSVSMTAGASRWFYVMKTSNRALKFVLYDDAGARFEAITANNVLTTTGNWDHLGVSWNLNAKPGSNQDRILLWVNGTLAKTQTFTTTWPISTAIGTLYIGDNRSTLGVEDNSGNPAAAGPRGTGYSAGNTIDELRVYNFEGGKGLIDRDRLQASACLSHYAINHAGTGTNCSPNAITITAHDASHGTVVMPNNTTTIQLSTSTGKGDWSLANGYGVLNNGTANDGMATYLFNGEYQVVLSLEHTQSGTVNINVTDGQFTESASEDPSIAISSCSGAAGFNACEVRTPRCTPLAGDTAYARLLTKLADQAFHLDLVALKSDGSLETAFTGQVQVDLLANTAEASVNPTTFCPAAQTAVIPLGSTVGFGSGASPADTAGYGKVSIASNAFSTVAPNYRAYRDVRVRFTCAATECPPSGLVRCSTDNFAVRPQDVSIAASISNNNSYPGTGGSKQQAGSDFTMSATAVPGYNGTLQIDRSAVATSLVTSCYGASSGCPSPANTIALRDASGNSVAVFGTAGIASGSTGNSVFQYHEAGTFRLEPGAVYDSIYTNVDQADDCIVGSSSNVVDANGKVGCTIANQAQWGLFGRFYPNNFAYESGSVTATAGTFSYFGQSGFGLTYTVSAKSLGNPAAGDSIVTTRYDATAPTLVAYNGTSATNLRAGSPLPVEWTPSGGGAWSSGQYTYTAGTTLVRPSAPAGPYDDLYFAVNIAESGLDGVTMTTTKDFKVGTPACTGGTCTHKKLNTTATKARFGRLRLLNHYGSELLPGRVEYRAEYWNSNAWLTNALHSGTVVGTANIAVGNGTLSPDPATFTVAPLTSGVGIITVPAPNVVGFFDLAFDLGGGSGNTLSTASTCESAGWSPNTTNGANLSFLTSQWCGSAFDKYPVARVKFGSPKAPYIYLRERY